MSKTHNLKTRPEHFRDVLLGIKKAELRRADRDFAIGDSLCLNEYGESEHDANLVGFTGAFIFVRITHITDVSEWAPGYVMLSIERRQASAT